MRATRQYLTAYLQAQTAVTTLLANGAASVVQEDTDAGNLASPFIVISFVGEEPLLDSQWFTRERWDIWVVTDARDYYTLGQISDAIRVALDRVDIAPTASGGAAPIAAEWVSDGPAASDPQLGLHTQAQRYWVLRQR